MIENRRLRINYEIKVVLLFLSVMFVAANLLYSQAISPLYAQLTNDDKSGAVEYLKKIVSLPDFQRELTTYKTLYGRDIENDIFRTKLDRQKMISQLENLLQKNNNAREVLYNLSLLYRADGNPIKAKTCLDKSKLIGPTISN